jgi:hypothetical protein
MPFIGSPPAGYNPGPWRSNMRLRRHTPLNGEYLERDRVQGHLSIASIASLRVTGGPSQSFPSQGGGHSSLLDLPRQGDEIVGHLAAATRTVDPLVGRAGRKQVATTAATDSAKGNTELRRQLQDLDGRARWVRFAAARPFGSQRQLGPA